MARKKRNSWGGKREGAGRPTDDPREKNLNMRTTEARIEAWRARAAESGLTLTAWIEQQLDKAAR